MLQSSPTMKIVRRQVLKYVAGKIFVTACMGADMLSMSKTKPESIRAGKKPVKRPHSALTSWARNVTEISKPCPRALRRNTEDIIKSAVYEPLNGTLKRTTVKRVQKIMPNMPMQK